jgi:hypothetical protein
MSDKAASSPTLAHRFAVPFRVNVEREPPLADGVCGTTTGFALYQGTPLGVPNAASLRGKAFRPWSSGQRLKPGGVRPLAARLKSCPDTNPMVATKDRGEGNSDFPAFSPSRGARFHSDGV